MFGRDMHLKFNFLGLIPVVGKIVAVPEFGGLGKRGEIVGNWLLCQFASIFYRLHRRSIPPNPPAFNNNKIPERNRNAHRNAAVTPACYTVDRRKSL